MRDEILMALSGTPGRLTPGAVSWSIGRRALGLLGQDPDPDVAQEIAGLLAEGAVAEIPGCPVCGTPGALLVLAGNLSPGDADPPPISVEELGETMEPLIAEGLIEVSEIVEFVERECCARTARAWRRAPRPS